MHARNAQHSCSNTPHKTAPHKTAPHLTSPHLPTPTRPHKSAASRKITSYTTATAVRYKSLPRPSPYYHCTAMHRDPWLAAAAATAACL